MKVVVERHGKVDIRKGDTRRRIAEAAIRHVAESTCCPCMGSTQPSRKTALISS